VDVGEAEVAAGIAIGELLVVEPEQPQDRGMWVVDVQRTASDTRLLDSEGLGTRQENMSSHLRAQGMQTVQRGQIGI
jgi:hypothetical protein